MVGSQVLIKIMHIIWTYVLDTWKLQTTHLHHNADQLNLPNYKQAATTLYELHDCLPPTAPFPTQQLNTMMISNPPEKPCCTAPVWVFFVHLRLIEISLKIVFPQSLS